MTRTPHTVPILVLVALAVLPCVGQEPGEPEPMTDEDVVRMLVTGVPTGEILETIRTSPTAFDLSDEMVQELRTAGVSESIIDAMRARQAEQDAPEETEVPAEAAPPEEGRARITVHIGPHDPDREEPRRLRFPAVAPEPLQESLELGPAPEDRMITGGAIFLACTNPTHVPDHWRRHSPLGRDFISMPRHRMLSFLPGGEAVSGSKTVRVAETALGVLTNDPDALRGSVEEREWVDLELPESVAAETEAGEVHDLLLGVALEIGGRFYLIRGAPVEEVIAGEGTTDLHADFITGRKSSGFQVEIAFVEPPVSGQDD
jgi:hypothetical protein